MASDAKRKENAKHMETPDRIVIQPKKETGARIRQAAADAGQSVR